MHRYFTEFTLNYSCRQDTSQQCSWFATFQGSNSIGQCAAHDGL